MSIIKTSLVVALVSVSASAFAKPAIEAADTSKASELCVIAATGNKQQLRVKINDFIPNTTVNSRNYRLIANKLSCNGNNVVDFAQILGNVAIAEHLDNYRRGNVQIRDLANNLSGKVIFTQG